MGERILPNVTGWCRPIPERPRDAGFFTYEPPTPSTKPETIFTCTQLNGSLCKLTRRSCELLPRFADLEERPATIIHCKTPAGRISLDVETRKVETPFTTNTLTPVEAAMLTALMRQPEIYLSTRALYRVSHPDDDYIPTNMRQNVRVTMARLRRKLGEELDGQELIQTSRKHYDGGHYRIARRQ